jgi:hypothetical protein
MELKRKRGQAYFVSVTCACVVNQNVHSSEFIECILYQLLPILFLGYIGLDEVHGMWMGGVRNTFSTNRTVWDVNV